MDYENSRIQKERPTPIYIRLRWMGPKDIFEIEEGLSKIGFWFQIKAAVNFEPEEYLSISRIQDERPTRIWDQKTFLRGLLTADPGRAIHPRRIPQPVFQNRRFNMFMKSIASHAVHPLGVQLLDIGKPPADHDGIRVQQ